MLKLFIITAAAGSVLVTGLVSCSKETKTTDVYHTQLPVIRTGQGSQDLKTWDLLKNKDLDIFDQLDFSASSPARILIRSSCRAGSDNFYGRGEFAGTSLLHIWESLPPEVLTTPFNKKQFSCGFEINLYNEVGSNHIYNLAPVPIVERAVSDARIAMESGAPMPARLSTVQLRDVRLRFSNSGPAAAKLICEDMEVATLPFEQVIDFAHFNLSAPIVRENRPPQILETRPVQNCRGLILERGKPVGLSNLVTVMAPRPPLFTTSLISHLFPMINLFTKVTVSLRDWVLFNPGSSPRIFKISRRPVPMSVWRLMFKIHPTEFPELQVHSKMLNYLSYQIRVSAGAEIARQDGPDSTTITLQPHQDVQLSAMFTGASTCPYLPVVAVNFQPSVPSLIEELDADGNSLEVFQLELKPFMLGDPGDSLDLFSEVRSCEWI